MANAGPECEAAFQDLPLAKIHAKDMWARGLPEDFSMLKDVLASRKIYVLLLLPRVWDNYGVSLTTGGVGLVGIAERAIAQGASVIKGVLFHELSHIGGVPGGHGAHRAETPAHQAADRVARECGGIRPVDWARLKGLTNF